MTCFLQQIFRLEHKFSKSTESLELDQIKVTYTATKFTSLALKVFNVGTLVLGGVIMLYYAVLSFPGMSLELKAMFFGQPIVASTPLLSVILLMLLFYFVFWWSNKSIRGILKIDHMGIHIEAKRNSEMLHWYKVIQIEDYNTKELRLKTSVGNRWLTFNDSPDKNKAIRQFEKVLTLLDQRQKINTNP